MSLTRSIKLFNYLADAPSLNRPDLLPPEADAATVFASLHRILDELNTIVTRRERRLARERIEIAHELPSADAGPVPISRTEHINKEAAQGILQGVNLSLKEYDRLDDRLKPFYVLGFVDQVVPSSHGFAWELKQVPKYVPRPLTQSDRNFLQRYIEARQS